MYTIIKYFYITQEEQVYGGDQLYSRMLERYKRVLKEKKIGRRMRERRQLKERKK